jgi:hypothetical protein
VLLDVEGEVEREVDGEELTEVEREVEGDVEVTSGPTQYPFPSITWVLVPLSLSSTQKPSPVAITIYFLAIILIYPFRE